MGQTEAILNAVIARLQSELGDALQVQLVPERPVDFVLEHARGAVLVAYGLSTFSLAQASDGLWQERHLSLNLTLVCRQFNGQDGAIDYLDRLRDCLAGWWPPHCDQPCRPVSERFIGQLQGVWQYSLEFTARATQLQAMAPASGPLLTQTRYEESL